MISKIVPTIIILNLLVASICTGQELNRRVPHSWEPSRSAEAIDVAIALDTSSSMQSLIDAARLKLWEIVNDLAELEPTPQLRVALLTYGNNKNDIKRGWVRVETSLTTDLDLVSQRLFELECAGGEEYVARALKTALEELEWNDSPHGIKLIFVAGNEPADQDKKIDLRSMGYETDAKGATLHAIYCGSERDPGATSWKELAQFAAGQFATIDQRTGTTIVETPVDRELAQLGASLNKTYIPLGEPGEQGIKIQAAQDRNVQALGVAAAATRAQTKASSLYDRDWDLVDAVHAGRLELYGIDESELPEIMRAMTPSEREDYVRDLLVKREEIRQRIRELGAQRRQYVAEQVEKKGLDDSRTFDGVVRRAIRQQVEDRGYRSDEP